MKRHALAVSMLALAAFADGARADDMMRWKREAGAVQIIRDDWGIAHIYGKRDADTVFGMIYAQAEDDFFRVERNYLVNLGWLARAEGEKAVWSDLRQSLFVDVETLKKQYQASPAWLKTLMNAWADGLNYYLATHPETHPQVITHFEPWMALCFTEGSIGGDMRTDTSNNTVYADADGTIAYFHGNFVPKRDPRFDFRHPVDGSDPATDWQGPSKLEETIMIKNPASGWLFNANNWPFTAAGPDSPKKENYPRYMWTNGENPRGPHAVEMMTGKKGFTLDSLIASAYDPHLTAFDVLLPPLLKAYDALPDSDPRRALKEPIEALRKWDHRTGVDSVPTAVAIYWGNELIDRKGQAAREADEPVYDFLAAGKVSDAEQLDALSAAIAKLTADFGTWNMAWGEINRFQRRTDDIVQPFDDSAPSLPVGMAPSRWGALASFDSSKPHLTKRIYGSVGNSFIAAVEFGPQIHAKALMSGGESGDPSSKHFADQSENYSKGKFRDVLFYKQDVEAHAERSYHPGEQTK